MRNLSDLTIQNHGKIRIENDLLSDNANATWVNNSGSSLRLDGETLPTNGELDATAPDNIIIYGGGSGQQIKESQNLEYDILQIRGGGGKVMQSNLTINNALIIRSTLNANDNDLFIEGDWDNKGTFNQGIESVTFTGENEQTLNAGGTQEFYDLDIDKNSGALNLNANIKISNNLSLTEGIITTDENKVIIGTGTNNEGEINVTNGYIEGTIERWITQTQTDYKFPFGQNGFYRPANVNFNDLSSGTLIGNFFSAYPGDQGLPLTDDTVDIYNPFNEGYWSLVTGNSMSSNDYDLELYANGFDNYDIVDFTRLISREDESNDWLANGSHVAASGDTVKRDGLSTSPSQLSAQYTLGDTTDCDPPAISSISGAENVCKGATNQTYEVSSAPVTFHWEVEGGTIVSGAGTHEITVDWDNTGQIGEISLQKENNCSKSPEEKLQVNVHPVPFDQIEGRDNVVAQTKGREYSVESRSNYSYSWTINGGTISDGSGSSTIFVDWGEAGEGQVIVESTHTSCGSTTPDTLDVEIMEIIESIDDGNWDETSTWDCNCVPQPSNSVRVLDHNIDLQEITVHDDNWSGGGPGGGSGDSVDIDPEITTLQIDEGGTLNNNGHDFLIYNNYALDGTHEGDNETTTIQGEIFEGLGTFSNGDIIFAGQSKEIPDFSDLTFQNNSTITLDEDIVIVNQGSVNIEDGDLEGNNAGSKWVNDDNSLLQVSGDLLNIGQLEADNTGNTIRYTDNANQTIKAANTNTYYNLELNGDSDKNLDDFIQINGNLTIYDQVTLDANDFNITIGGNWINEGDFIPGNNRVIFNGASVQQINVEGGEIFNELRIAKSGSKILLENDVTVHDELIMEVGAIDVNGRLLTLGENANNPGTLSYSQGTILGAFERWITTENNQYLFPVGTQSNVREAAYTPQTISQDGTVTFEFIPQDPGEYGLPFVDGSEEVFKVFPEGYWTMSPEEGFNGGDFDLELGFSGFSTYTIDETSRLITRDDPNSDWKGEGNHLNATNDRVRRDDLFSLPANFAIADTNSCDPPVTSEISGADSVCVNTNDVIYSVEDNEGSTYTWTINGGSISSGKGSHSISVNWNSSTDPARVKVIEDNGCLSGDPVELEVTKHTRPVKAINGPQSVEENSTDITYAVEDPVEGYSYSWTVEEGSITSGQGTASIDVDWGSPGLGSVKVQASSDCGTAQSKEISVNIYGLIESVQTGNWTDPNTWDCNCVPTPTDNVKINDPENESPHIVSLTDNRTTNNLIIRGDLNNDGNRIDINGNYTIFGSHYGEGNTNLRGNNTVIAGTGQIGISDTFNVQFFNKDIPSNADITVSDSTIFQISGVEINNKGKVLVEGDLTGTNNASVWKNASGSELIAESSIFSSSGLLNAADDNNLVEFSGNTPQTIPQPASTHYYNLTLSGSDAKTMNGELTINNDLTIHSTLNADGYNIEILGDWTDNGTYQGNGNTVSFTGSNEQNISGSAQTDFSSFTINKSEENLVGGQSFTIGETLTMSGGDILMSGDTLTVGENASNPGSVVHNSGNIEGVIGHWISSSKSDYFFPLGFDGEERFGDFTLNDFNEGLFYFYFDDSDPGDQNLPVNDDGQSLSFMFEEGFWVLDADQGFSINDDFDVELTPGGFSTFPINEENRVLTKDPGSGDWLAEGSHLRGFDETAKRENISIFPSELGLADTTSCEPANVEAINGPDSVCTNDQSINYNIDDPDANSTYDWDVNGGTIVSGQGTDNIEVDWDDQGGKYTIEVTQTNACQYTDTFEDTVIVEPLPTSSIFGPATVTENTSGIDYSVEGIEGYTYNWDIENGTVSEGQGSENIKVDWGSAGSGKVKVEGSNPCGSADTVELSVNIVPAITSVQSGDWGDPSTWDCNCVPDQNDKVNIDTGHTVTLQQGRLVNDIHIREDGELDNQTHLFSAYGNYRVDGTHSGNERTDLWGDLTTIDGTGIISYSEKLRVLGQDKVIENTAELVQQNGDVFIDNPFSITNKGTFTLAEDLTTNGSNSKWINDSGAVLNVGGAIFPDNQAALEANAIDNLVRYQGDTNQIIYTPSDNQYYNLEIDGTGDKTLQDSLSIAGDLTLSEGNFDVTSDAYNFSIEGNFENNSDFSAQGNTVYFTGNTEIKGSETTQFSDVVIEDTLEAKEDGEVKIEQDWTNNGDFLHNEGRILFNGNQQEVDGGTDFNSLTFESSSSTTLSSDTSTIRSDLLVDGDLQTNGNLRLLSSEDRTALIDGDGTGEVNGDVTMERYRSTSFGYTYLSSPFQNTQVEDLAHFVDLGAEFPRFFRYHEPSETSGWEEYTDSSNTLTVGEGYAANLGSDTQEVIMDFSGEVNNDSITYDNLTNNDEDFTNGFNLVGNPYPSPIDWGDSASWERHGIDAATYFFSASDTDQYGGTYKSRVNGIETGDASDTIAAMQGFFVRVSDDTTEGSITFTNDTRVNVFDPVFFKRKDEDYRPIINLGLKASKGPDYVDETAVYFDNKSKKGFDSDFDAIKKMNTADYAPNFYSLSRDERRLSIQAIDEDHDQNRIIPLGYHVNDDGEYVFTLSEMNHMDKNVYLEDLKKGTTIEVQSGFAHAFYSDEGTFEERFRLIFSEDDQIDYFNERNNEGIFDAFSHGRNLFVSYNHPEKLPGDLALYNMTGRKVYEKTLPENRDYKLFVRNAQGVYVAVLHYGDEEETRKIYLGQ